MPIIKALGGKIVGSALTDVVFNTTSLHSDVIVFRNNVMAAGGTLTELELIALNVFVRALYANNLVQRIMHFYPLLGTTAASQKIALYGNNITFTSTSACHTSLGFCPLGSLSNYGNTGVSNIYAQSSGIGGCQVYVSKTGTANTNEMLFFSVIRASYGYGIALYGSGTFYTDYYADQSWTASGMGNNRKGNWMFSRTSSSTMITKDKFNGKVSRTYTQTNTTQSGYSPNMTLGGQFLSPTSSTIGCASLLSGMTSAEVDIYDSLILNFMSQVSR